MVITSLPGEEAQVDFGYIGYIMVNDKPKKSWILVMSLSYSMYMYPSFVFDQIVKTFIQCHTKAFRYFGGAPETVKIYNLKAAIVEVHFYKPVTQRHKLPLPRTMVSGHSPTASTLLPIRAR